MPFFYLLSGFIMVIAYAAKPVACPSLQEVCTGKKCIDVQHVPANKPEAAEDESLRPANKPEADQDESPRPANKPEAAQDESLRPANKQQTYEDQANPSKSRPRGFEVRRFWRNRFARLFPVYLATNLLTLPLTYYPPRLLTITGQNSIRSLVFGSLGLTSWSGLTLSIGKLLPGPPSSGPKSFLLPPNNVTWTISTMMSFYLGPYTSYAVDRYE